VVAAESADLGMPEVTLPVIPGMEGCHWIFRKCGPESWDTLLRFLLEGRSVKAKTAVGWLVDYAGPLQECIRTCWSIAKGESGMVRRAVNQKPLFGLPAEPSGLSAAGPAVEAARQAILNTIRESCAVPLSEAISVQAMHSGVFMTSTHCRAGMIGASFERLATA